MHAGKVGIGRVPACAGSAAAWPWSKGPGRALAVVALACLAICPPSFVCDSPVLGFACAATWPLGSPRDSLILDYQAAYSYQGSSCTHRGVDIAAPAGSLVLAPCSGTIAFCGAVPASQADGGADDGLTMTAVSIQLDDGRRLTLMPFKNVLVSSGEAVCEGQELGGLAASGDRSSAQPHLHMGLKDQGTYSNPLELFGSAAVAGSAAAEQEGSAPSGEASLSAPAAPAAQAASGQVLASQAAGELPSFGTVSSGGPDYEPSPEQEPQTATGALRSVAEGLAAACGAQLGSLLDGLAELSEATGIPFFALVFASTALGVGILAALALQLMHLRGERCTPLNGKADENALLCVRVGGDNMHKLFPAPGTSFITRGRSAQRR